MKEWQIWHDGEELGLVYASTPRQALFKYLQDQPYLEGLEIYPSAFQAA